MTGCCPPSVDRPTADGPGSVRASVIDSMSYNFRTIVVSECVGDRAIGPHEANLFDMGQKYADLMTRDEVITELESRESS